MSKQLQQQQEQNLKTRDPAPINVGQKYSVSSSTTTISSADLPAEFRGGDSADTDLDAETPERIVVVDSGQSQGNRLIYKPPEAASNGARKASQTPREQSRLARLCQQTSSVLASILPAPFGGHERSILCQFFGNVQVGTGSSGANSSLGLFGRSKHSKSDQKGPMHGSRVRHDMDPPMVEMERGQSVAVLHQGDRPPVTMLANGKHPIQLVLEQQRGLYSNPTTGAAPQRQQYSFTANSQMFGPMVNSPNDLKASASVISNAYHQRLIPPASMFTKPSERPINIITQTTTLLQGVKQKPIRFSEPLVTVPDNTVTPNPRGALSTTSLAISTRGWRGLNDSSTTSTTTTTISPVSGRSYTAANRTLDPNQLVNSTTTAQKIFTTDQNINDKQPQRQTPIPFSLTTTVAKRSETAQSMGQNPKVGFVATSPKMPDSHSNSDPLIRTIEVVSQAISHQTNTTSGEDRNEFQKQDADLLINKTDTAPEMNQKREELVIASINNLTRIAFGNHLRDTVRVINKLIDQQSGLFSKGPAEPMLNSESKTYNVTVRAPIKSDPKVLAPNTSSSWIVGEKLKAGKLLTSKSADSSKDLVSSSSLPHKYTSPPADAYSFRESSTTRGRSKKVSIDKQPAHVNPITNSKKNISRPTSTTKVYGAQYAKLEKLNPAKQYLTIASLQLPSKELKRLSHTVNPKIGSHELLRTTSGLNSDSTPYLAPKSDLYRGNSLGPPSGKQRKIVESVTNKLKNPIQTQQQPGRYSYHQRDVTSTLHKQPQQQTTGAPTRFNWLLPDKSAYRTDLFENEANANSQSDRYVPAQSKYRPETTTAPMQVKKWTTRKPVSSEDGSRHWGQLPPKPALMLNRVEPTGELATTQSTLKMSVSDSFPVQTSQSDLQANIISTKTTNDDMSTANQRSNNADDTGRGGGVQSRWIPTVVMTRLPLQTTFSTPMSKNLAPVTTSAISSSTTTPAPTTTAPTATTLSTSTSTAGPFKLFASTPTVDSTEAPATANDLATSQNNINEVRASDSISRYTTHWNVEPNELLATTRRYLVQPLPQIANTGEYFSAETISSWPEKYQAMIERATSPSADTSTTKSGFNLETTRRNGYTFEQRQDTGEIQSMTTNSRMDQQPNQSASLSSVLLDIGSPRHRAEPPDPSPSPYSDQPATSKQQTSTTPMVVPPIGGIFAAPLSGITVLPPNHKLTPSTASLPEEQQMTNTETADKSTADVTIQQSQDEDEDLETDQTADGSAVRDERQTTPYRESISADVNTLTTAHQPQSTPLQLPGMTDANQQKDQSDALSKKMKISKPANASANIILKAPYITENIDQVSDATVALEAGRPRPHVSRKLYDLLVPSTKTFVGAHNPLNQPKFNLSALKFLAQNLFAPLHNHLSSNHSTSINETATDANAYRLLDSLGGPTAMSTDQSGPLVELDLMNEQSQVPSNSSEPLEDEVNTTMRPNSTSSPARSVFQKTGNLLQDLKKMEQRRAAAILAAIRYQVPSPLVRPWDLATDLFPIAGSLSPVSMTSNLTDRFDAATGNLSPSETADMLVKDRLAAISRAIKSALFKQRLVPRNELEARLNRGRNMDADTTIYNDANRRLDSDQRYTIDPKDINLYEYQQGLRSR